MTAHAQRHGTLARAALLCAALVLATGCTPPGEPPPPTLDEALDAANDLLATNEHLLEVIVEPRPGKGSGEFTFPATEVARDVMIRCLGAGEIVVRVDGEERFADACDDSTLVMGLYGVGGAGGANTITRTDSESVIELEADDDVYWVASLYTHTNGA